MSQTSHEPQNSSAPPTSGVQESVSRLQAPLPAPEHRPSPTWQAWAYFGGAIMSISGLFWAALGVIALADEEFFAVRSNGLFGIDSYAPWGWVHLIGGLAALAAGAGILWGGHRWARNTAVVIAALSAVVNLGFLSSSPVWSTLIIGFDVIVIYALTVHGWEIDDS
jgi:hypothetical protein